MSNRFHFGKNWHDFITKNFSDERLETSKQHILRFLNLENLNGFTFMDIGCGSGLHSLAALWAGARSVVAFDYDPDGVEAAKYLRARAESSGNWSIEQGDVLDQSFMESLEPVDIVYSWGVLHHTGDMWNAVRNAAIPVKPGGLFYIALYSANMQINPPPEFWLEVKQRYVNSGRGRRFMMVLWYIWRFEMHYNIFLFPRVLRRIAKHPSGRGMNYFTDIRDWIGGWPMEFARDENVIGFAKNELGMDLVNITTGEANTEFLFRKRLVE